MELIIDKSLKKDHWNEKDKISAIYIVTNIINNKKYVGQTANVRKRFADYNGKKYLTAKTPVYRAIKKYGPENFTFEVLPCPREKLDKMEKKFIKNLKTTNPDYGYNKLHGANGATRLDDVRKLLSEVHTGMTESADTKRKKSNRIIMINDEKHIVIISDSGKLAGDYLGKSKDYIKNCLRQPSSLNSFRFYYADPEKRTQILQKMYAKRSIRDKNYVAYGEYLNSIESESVETIYELITKKFGKIYELSYNDDDDSVSIREFVLPTISEVTNDEIEQAYQENQDEEYKNRDL